jgi:hypothetical protein
MGIAGVRDHRNPVSAVAETAIITIIARLATNLTGPAEGSFDAAPGRVAAVTGSDHLNATVSRIAVSREKNTKP